jgi:ribonuclease BN (tRNA processing enzyme)
MKLHILGCGDAFGSGGRNQSGYLVEASDRMFLLDCGPTSLLAMKRAKIDPRRLDAILLSHLHGDHFGGIPFFFIEYLYQRPKQKPLTIASPTRHGIESATTFPAHVWQRNQRGELRRRVPTLYPISVHIDGIEVLPFVPHQSHEISLGLKLSMTASCYFFRRLGVDRDLHRTGARRRFISLRVFVLQ